MLHLGGRTFYEESDFAGLLSLGQLAGRTTPEPIVGAQLGIAPILTNFLLTTATEQQSFAGPRLFPDLDIPAANVTIVQTLGESLVSRETQRGYLAEMRLATGKAATFTAKVLRRTLGSPVDADEISNENFIMPAQRAILISRAGVDLSIEVSRAGLVANAGNFATTIALTSGNGWATTGTMKANIETAIAAIQTSVGIQRDQLELALLGIGAATAARSDTTFSTKRIYKSGADFPDLSAVRDYLGIGDVWAAAPVVKLTEAAAVTQLYADQAILYYPGNPALLGGGSNQVGGLAWARNLNWSAGNRALPPFYSDMRTAWVYPFQAWEGSHVFDSRLAVRITGISL
jgi:hypothetical protein